MNLPEFSVKHSIFGNMLTILVFVGGVLMAMNLQRDTFPEIELDLVVISTYYPNASPEEVEDLITNPIEDELRDVEDIEEFNSSSVEGVSVIVVQIDPEAKYKERAITDIQRKVDQVTNLPEGAEDPTVEAISTRGPIIRVCVSGDVSEPALRDYGDYLKDVLERIANVSTITQSGWRDEEFWVEVDLPALKDQELSLTDITRSLALQNVNRPGGKLPLGQREVVLRTIGQFHTSAGISNVVIRSNTDGHHVRVGDLATVRRTFEEDTVFSKANGTRCVVLGVKKKTSGDTITIADTVKQVVKDEGLRAPEGIRISLVDDESYYVKRRLNVLRSNGLIGLVLVGAVLFMFLNMRVAMITAVGIPFSFLGALLIMSFFDITINLMTMFALIIVLGMVVDDAIIVGENVFRHMEEGMDPHAAAIRGTTEVMRPVISTVLTTVAAFLPLIFAPDIFGQVLRWLPIVVTMALGASLVEVLFVMPCHVADFVRPLPPARLNHRDGAGRHPWMSRILKVYTAVIRSALRWRYVSVLLVLVVFAGMLLVAKTHMKVIIFPGDLIDIFTVRITAPQGTSLGVTDEITSGVEKLVGSLPAGELENIVTYVGGQIDLAGGYKARGTHYSSLVVYLTPQNTRERKTQTIVDGLREQAASIEGVEKVEFEMIKPGPPAGRAVEVKVVGGDFDTLQRIAGDIMDFLRQQPGVSDVQQDYEPGKEELHVKLDRAEAARLGLSVRTVADIVYAAFQGAEATIVREGNEEIKVRVRLKEPFRDQRESLDVLTVPNATGRLIPLSRVARFEETVGLPNIFHYNGDRSITITGEVDTDITSSAGVNAAVQEAFAGIPKDHPGYQYIIGGEGEETRKLVRFMIQALFAALLLIYAILAVQFDSFAQPLVVMVAIPLGMIGVIIALILHGKPLSIMAMMGMIGLTGVVVNDAIVLVKFVNDQRRHHGASAFDAIVTAGRQRLRPILLTSVTTISGLLPVIYGWGGYEPFIAPAAITLAYGLLFATVLTLLVIPCFYHIGLDLKHGTRASFRWVMTLPSRTRSHRNRKCARRQSRDSGYNRTP